MNSDMPGLNIEVPKGMKIDSVTKEDEHKVRIRVYDGEGGVILLAISAGEDGLNIIALDHNLAHLTKFRVAVCNTEFVTHLPLVELT